LGGQAHLKGTVASRSIRSEFSSTGSVQILSETLGENNIGSIFAELQPDADKLRTKPFPLGADHDKSGLGFQIASSARGFATEIIG
jgi:hypothetical protein